MPPVPGVGVVFLFAVGSFAQTAPQAVHWAEIRGAVRDKVTGAPVRGATVILTEVRGEERLAAGTADDGTFRFPEVEPGRYHLMAEASGYLQAWWGQGTAERQPLVLQPGQRITDATIRLMPAGSISGRVEDETGRPVADVEVRPIVADEQAGRPDYGARCSITDDRGEYRCHGMSPGRYFLSARPPESLSRRAALPSSAAAAAKPGAPRLAYVPMYLPGVIGTGEATAIEMTPGLQLSGMNVRLVRTPVVTLRGRVVDEGANEPPRDPAMVFARWMDSPLRNTQPSRMRDDGRYEFATLSPGRYEVRATAGAKKVRTEITLDGATPEVELELTLRTGVTVSGRVIPRPDVGCHQFGFRNSFGIEVTLESSPPGGESFNGKPGDDGSFRIENVIPGEYLAQLLDIESRCFAREAALNGRSLPENRMEVPAGGLSGLQITPGAAGWVKGTVLDAEGRPVSGAAVVCVGKDGGGQPKPICTRVTTDQDGNFEMLSLIPGKVRLLALTGWRGGSLPADSDSRYKEIEIKENEEARVELKAAVVRD